MAMRPASLRTSTKPTYDKQRGTARERGYTTQWDKARAGFLARHPLCAACEGEGRIEPAGVVDHIIPHKSDKSQFWKSEWWQPLCETDHNRKTFKHDARYQPMQSRRREVVCGAPGSGKTTYVEAQRKAGDLVYDMDALAAVLFQCPTYPRPDTVHDSMLSLRRWVVSRANVMHCNVFVIISDEAEANEVASQIGGTVKHMKARTVESP